jgi:hypothetical protein
MLLATMQKAAEAGGVKMPEVTAPAPDFVAYAAEGVGKVPTKCLPISQPFEQYLGRAWYKALTKADLSTSPHAAVSRRVRPHREFARQSVNYHKHLRSDFRWSETFIPGNFPPLPKEIGVASADFRQNWHRWRDMCMSVSAQAFPLIKLQALLDDFPTNALTPYFRTFLELQKDLFSAAAKTAAEGLVANTVLARDLLVQKEWKVISHEDESRGRLKSAALKEGVALYDLQGEIHYWDKKAQRNLTSTLTQSASKALQGSAKGSSSSSSFRRDNRRDDAQKAPPPKNQAPQQKDSSLQQSNRVGFPV